MSTCATPTIIGRGIVSAIGCDIPSVWKNITEQNSGIKSSTLSEFPVAAINKDAKSCAYDIASLALSQALKEANLSPAELKNTHLILATTKAEIAELEAYVKTGSQEFKNLESGAMAENLAHDFQLGLGSSAVSLACASSTIATSLAAELTIRGDADFVIVLGVDVLSEFIISGFAALKSLSPSGCKPFDANRNGLSLGEGAAAIIITNKQSNKFANILGWGTSNDANHITGPSRDGSGLALAINRAMQTAKLQPQSIGYISAHGTGTLYNDAMEAKAFFSVFGNNCPITSSLKSIFGHTLAAAGIIEVIITELALNNGLFPGTYGLTEIGVEEQIPIISNNTPKDARVAISTNSGFGGINAALILGRSN